MTADLIVFSSRDAMAERIAALLEITIERAHGQGEHAEIAVSGGSTPKAVYETLAVRDLAWDRTTLTLVDERWVDINHPRSNEAFIQNAFASATGVELAGLYTGSQSPTEAIGSVTENLAKRRKPFDAVVLGMGGDGHTASWFPNAEGLDVALQSQDRVCAIKAVPSDVTGDEVDRMTLTLSAIRDAEIVILLIAGADKRIAFEAAAQDGPVNDMPVRAILRARPDLWVCWAP